MDFSGFRCSTSSEPRGGSTEGTACLLLQNKPTKKKPTTKYAKLPPKSQFLVGVCGLRMGKLLWVPALFVLLAGWFRWVSELDVVVVLVMAQLTVIRAAPFPGFHRAVKG